MLLLAVIAGIAGWYSREYWMRLGSDASWRGRFLPWALQGIAFPWLAWSLANVGWGHAFPAFVPKIVEAQIAKGPWFRYWLEASLEGLVLIWLYWTAVTYGWLLQRIIVLAPSRAEVLFNIAVFGFFSGVVAALGVVALGWTALGGAVALALFPVVHFTIDLAEKPPPRPSYDKAIGKIKFGKYQDAEWEVISQLEKAEDDFDGWMMLAELYARQYRNLEDAARVILDICQHPSAQAIHISVACHKLADWQLAIGENPLGARAALELLCRKLPGTHFARMAQQRLQQIPRSEAEFDESKRPRAIRLPSLGEEPAPAQPATPQSRQEAAAEANRLTDRLTENPNDLTTREKLARVLAEKLGKINLAVEQLELLLELDAPSDEQKARWLAQIATWEFDQGHDREKFAAGLRRIIAEFPQTSQAFAAQRRLYLLEMEFAERPAAS